MPEWWHVYGRMGDEGAVVILVGPTLFGPDDAPPLPEDLGAAYAWLDSLNHEPTEAERDAYLEQVRLHA